jgi:hypothetical protein
MTLQPFALPQIYYIIKNSRPPFRIHIEKFNMLCVRNAFYWIFMSSANRLRARKKLFCHFSLSVHGFFFPFCWTRQLLNNKTKSVINFISPSSYITNFSSSLSPTELFVVRSSDVKLFSFFHLFELKSINGCN